jgi:RHS repeat-associated protein
MPINSEVLLCRYYYDPLDRLVSSSSSLSENTKWFHLRDRLTTEICNEARRSIFQYKDQLLAQRNSQYSVTKNILLTTDQQHSVLSATGSIKPCILAYTPFGHRTINHEACSLLGFNGERVDSTTGHYLLGNGYRAFNPVLMRFNSPDNLSPFGEGGINAYTRIDPINFYDPTGHWVVPILKSAYNKTLKILNSITGQHTKTIKNLRVLGEDFYAYEDIYKKNLRRITFDAHSGVKNGKRYILSGDRKIAPHELKSIAAKNNINLDEYDSIRLLVCQSADELNGTSLAQVVANETGLNVKSFHGNVKADNISNLGYKMKKGQIYQPTNNFTIYKKKGPLSYFATSSSDNYRPTTVHPIRQKI